MFVKTTNVLGGIFSFLLIFLFFNSNLSAQGKGNIKGKIVDNNNNPIPYVNVVVENTTTGAAADSKGEYTISNIDEGTYTLKATAIGYKTVTAQVTVQANRTVMQDFTMSSDLLNMNEVVVTGVVAPLSKMKSTVAISTLTPRDLEQMQPRSTTEILRYVPGFTRIESSGGEVNENISMRGILGVEYVMFMEDGLPVFPTMHTFFMNADNLFRPDLNIQKVEVVRGGNSALFGSNTPGAIINFIDKTGGTETKGIMKWSAATQAYARYDFDVNGPITGDWRYNVGGFYRYDHGVRDPGFPGISGGQLKANVSKLMDNGFIRFSLKYINDRNQFILDLPFQGTTNPDYVSGLSDYVSMNTDEGNDISVPTPDGRLNLPLDHGLYTNAYWLTADVGFNFENGWGIENAAQIMSNNQEWNAILPFDVMTKDAFINSLNLPSGYNAELFYTHPDNGLAAQTFNTPNNLIAPGGEWHVNKPISAFQDQFQVKKSFGPHNFSLGIYFANYSQINNWYFTNITTDVRDIPKFLDIVAIKPGADTLYYSKNGFTNFMSNYVNGTGRTTIFSSVLGGSIQITDQLRADLGIRYEWDQFNQSTENTSTLNLDGDTTTLYDNNFLWGNNSYRHFSRWIQDYAASVGLNYSINDNYSVYVQGSRAYKMPALDEFLNAASQAQTNVFEDRQILSGEAGIKYTSPLLGYTLDIFWTKLKNITGQGAVVDPNTGQTIWLVTTSPQNISKGIELELSTTPFEGLRIMANGTALEATLGTGAGADIGSLINGVPGFIGNISGTYTFDNLTLLADYHFVGIRYTDAASGTNLPPYGYLNLGLSYNVPNSGITIDANLSNALMSKGLEEGNPRKILFAGGPTPMYLARPILPRRFFLDLIYSF
jgi:outer membrane receptor protein involved in Fe transport